MSDSPLFNTVCLIGIGLIGLQDKEGLLAPLRTWNRAIVRITGFVINLTPYGVFAIGAVTAGTMDLETLARLEVYFVVFAVASLLLAFVILPFLVTAVTPFRYREVSGIARDALLTALSPIAPSSCYPFWWTVRRNCWTSTACWTNTPTRPPMS